jgi:hypothetical protein
VRDARRTSPSRARAAHLGAMRELATYLAVIVPVAVAVMALARCAATF